MKKQTEMKPVSEKTPKTKICTRCKKEFPATEEYFFRGTVAQGYTDGLRSWCKTCHKDFSKAWARTHRVQVREYVRKYQRKKGTAQNTQEHRDWVQKMVEKQTGMNKCAICGKPYEQSRRFVRHHVNYETDTIILLCFACHAWLHGQTGVFGHEFKSHYAPDEAPFVFANAVVRAYMEHDPRLQEVVRINLNTLKKVKK